MVEAGLPSPRVIRIGDLKPVALELVESDSDHPVPFEQGEHGRMLFFNRDGRLSTIVFDSHESVDLRELPYDPHIPSDAELVLLFNANDIKPEFEEDLIPDSVSNVVPLRSRPVILDDDGSID